MDIYTWFADGPQRAAAGRLQALGSASRMLAGTTLVLASVLMLLSPWLAAHAMPPEPEREARAQVTASQVTVSVGTGAEYELPQGGRLDLPIGVSVTGALGLSSATVRVKYDPVELRPVACVQEAGGPGGYCNLAWDTAAGLVRFNILAGDGLLGGSIGLFTLSFEPAAGATPGRVSNVTPLLEAIADIHGNYMTSAMLGSGVRVVSSGVTGPAIRVGSTPNPISLMRGGTVTVPVVISGVAGLGSASFSLSFASAVVHAVDCHPVQHPDASGACAIHSDHVAANLLSAPGLSGDITAFDVVFAPAPLADWPDQSALGLTLNAFAATNGLPIPVQVYNNRIEISPDTAGPAPVLRMSPAELILSGNQQVTIDFYLDGGEALVSGSWGIKFDSAVIEPAGCSLDVLGACNPGGEPGVVRMSVLRDPSGAPFQSHLGTLTFRRDPQAPPAAETGVVFDVTGFANAEEEQIPYQVANSKITLQDAPGETPAVSMSLEGPAAGAYPLPLGGFLEFPIRLDVDPAQPLVNLSASIHYDPAVLRATGCARRDGGAGPSGYCSVQPQSSGVIRFNALAGSDQGFSGSYTPFVFRVEPNSTAKVGDTSALHFTVEAITGPSGVPASWSAEDEAVSIDAPVNAARVVVGPPATTTTSIFVLPLGETVTAPVSVANVTGLGAATVEISYDASVVRATGCTLRSDLTSQLDGGFCSFLPGAVRAALVASGGIDGDARLFDIEFSQAPSVVGGEQSELTVTVDSFVDTNQVPIPSTTVGGRVAIGCYAEPVQDLRIARAGDNLALTWSHVANATGGYQVWRAEQNPYFAYGDGGSTSIGTLPAPAGPPGTAVSFTDVVGVVGPTGTVGPWKDDINHYYMVRALCSGFGSQPSNRVGKFTRLLTPGWNLVSWPLLAYDTSLDALLGTQLHGGDQPEEADRLLVWNSSSHRYSPAWFCSGSDCEAFGPDYMDRWLDDKYNQTALTLPPDAGFWLANRTASPELLKIVGAVPTNPGSALLGTAFLSHPKQAPLDARLPAAGAPPVYFSWATFDPQGSRARGVYDGAADCEQPLQTGDYVQLIWIGPDGVPNLPNEDGSPGSDDELVDEATVENTLRPPTASDRGYIQYEGIDLDPDNPQHQRWIGGTVYMRAWNAPKPAPGSSFPLDALYGNASTTFQLTDKSIYNALAWCTRPATHPPPKHRVWLPLVFRQ